jgi:hypothetical protein
MHGTDDDTSDDSPAKRPQIRCPHCGDFFGAEQLAARRKYRNKYGIDVFGCPACSQPIKIEPAEYLFAKQQIEAGEYDEDTAIGAVLEHELLPSERSAKGAGRSSGGCLPSVAGIVVVVGGAWYLLG